MVGYEVLTGAVTLNDGGHHVLRNVLVVGKELLGILGKTVATVAEGGVIIMVANAWIETNATDDRCRVETLDFGISIQLVEVADAKSEVGVGKKFDSLGLLEPHEEQGDTLCKLRMDNGQWRIDLRMTVC